MKTVEKAHGKTLQVDPARGTPEPTRAREIWIKPEIVSFKPITAARGISYTPNDGISNLTP